MLLGLAPLACDGDEEHQHLGEVDLVNPHFNRFDEPMYVVEITGPQTGNCLDLYDAIDGEYTLGACFYPTRP